MFIVPRIQRAARTAQCAAKAMRIAGYIICGS